MKFIKDNMRTIVAVTIAMILIIVSIIYLVLNKEHGYITQDKYDKNQQIIDVTGMSGDDAINIIKGKYYNSDYSFEVEITKDNLYKVVVTNAKDGSIATYYVDPSSKLAYKDIDTN